MAIVITVFGSGTCESATPAYEHASQLGQAIAQAGWTLCNGGYGGTMEAAARGAVEAGGHTIGVTCRIPQWPGPANRWIRQEVPTFDLLSRLNILVRLADGFVGLPGGTGTLLEVALVWELVNKGLLPVFSSPAARKPSKAPDPASGAAYVRVPTGRVPPFVLLGDCWRPVIDTIRRQQPSAPDLPVVADVGVAIDLLKDELNSNHTGTNAP